MQRRQPKQREDVHDAKAAGADERDDHGQHGVPHAADGAYHGVHHPAQEVAGGDHRQTGHPGFDHLRAFGVKVEQHSSIQNGAGAENDAGDEHAQQAAAQDLSDPLVFAGADVLAGEGQGRLVEGIHGNIHEPFDIAGGSASRHDDGAEGIDAALDDHVGQAEQRALPEIRSARS